MELVMIPGQNVIMCDTVHGIMMAALKYVELIREHHPYEYGPRAIYRVIAARCCDAGVSAKLIRKFFSDCVEQHGSHQQPQFRDQEKTEALRIPGPAVAHVHLRLRGPGCLSVVSGTLRQDALTLG